VVRAWSDLSFAAVRTGNLSDAQAARLYAMVDGAMYDAVNATAGAPKRSAAIVAAPGPVAGNPAAAAAGAAHDVLVALFPAGAAAYDAELAADLAAVSSPADAQRGRDWGADVAAQVLAARSNDGSAPNQTQPGDLGIGRFQDPWTGVQFQNLQPFVIADPDAYVGHGPPPLTSRAYAAAFNEVKVLGDKNVPDAAKKATYDFWALGGRTNQPPGAWLQVAEAVSLSRRLSLPDTARLFALESMAMADTVAPTYKTKVVFHAWRPTRAIHEADLDGNPDTVADPNWSARAGTAGGTPEHWSGHSSFSAAAATVMAGFFCDDHVPFTLTTDPTNGQPTGSRTYNRFSTAALEAGRSRILGGLHFEFSNRAGLIAGVSIGSEVLSRALLLDRGPTHRGACPR
jgi:hypothetical protein